MSGINDEMDWLRRHAERIDKAQPKAADEQAMDWLRQQAGPATMQDRAQAAAAGVNAGALSYLPGLPVKFALDIADLARAGFGAAGRAVGALSPEQMPELIDRANVVGSPEWIQTKIRGVGGGKVIDPNRPTDPASRVAYSAGAAIGAAPIPSATIPAALSNIGKMAASGALAQSVAEAGAPEWSMVAGMAPFAPAAMRSNRPAAPLLTPEQVADRQAAKALGYELTPGQETGKRWQQNIEAAMRQAPSTSNRMQQIDAGNQRLTNRLVNEALDSAGGRIDQDTAASRAFQAMREATQAQADKTGVAYRKLLTGVPVNIAAERPRLEALQKGQSVLPEDQRGGAGMVALDNLLGTPGYAARTRKGPASTALDVQRDDIVTAVRKLGGINPMDEAIGSLATSFPFEGNPAFGPVWRAQKFGGQGNRTNTVAGHSLDEITRKLYDKGYTSSPSAYDEVIDKLADQSRGVNQHYSVYREPPSQDPLANAIGDLVAQMQVKNRPPEAKPGYLRDNPTIPGEIAQDLRSAYGAASEAAFTGGKTQQGQVFLSLKQAVDRAIKSSLPKDRQGQFAALNTKYGLDMAIKAMEPKSQAAFLEQLYRGAPDQFYTFMGIVDPASFKSVARGFLSRIVDRSTNAESGNISGARIGRTLDELASEKTGRADVVKYLGGGAGEQLQQIGRIGRDILPDAVANSGTAQRMWYQHLLRGAGIASGGGVGGLLAGAPGAVAGAYFGDYLVPKAIQGAYLSPKMRGLLTAEPVEGLSAEARRKREAMQLLGFSTHQ